MILVRSSGCHPHAIHLLHEGDRFITRGIGHHQKEKWERGLELFVNGIAEKFKLKLRICITFCCYVGARIHTYIESFQTLRPIEGLITNKAATVARSAARKYDSCEAFFLRIYKSDIRPFIEYCCRIGPGVSAVFLEIIDNIQ